jgi:hypothetical protein
MFAFLVAHLFTGVRVIEAVPKRSEFSVQYFSIVQRWCSAAGKILRRELRELAKQEMARGEIDTGFKSKL